MIDSRFRSRAGWRTLITIVAMAWLAACGGNKPPIVPAGNSAPDQFLFQRATAAMMRQRWLDARKYFQQIVDNYPQSPLRADAKLGVGDSYLEQAGDMRDTYADTARAREDLAFAPAVTLEQGLRAQFQWMTEAGLFNA